MRVHRAVATGSAVALNIIEKLEFVPSGEATHEGSRYAVFVLQR